MNTGNTKTSAAMPGASYYDANFQLEAAKVLPGEFIATNRDMLLVTVLGSCVSVCLRDPVAGVAGLNHFSLPDGVSDQDALTNLPERYGQHAMEVLIDEMVRLGGDRRRFEAKVFGGGSVLRGMLKSNIGERNVDFVRRFLAEESVPVLAEDLLDCYPRKVYYFTLSGRVLVKKIKDVHNRTIYERECAYRDRLRRQPFKGFPS
ncbi:MULTISPECIES: chemoreceptor glutamine deamidase CheD [Microvirgula]|uniref:Probable chemoreceptor glutamine deamidase CheD n=1 Tax=Microvirgula aerodenitrificans TaxID=57480 RepID=A0A2S0P7J5_9NEIS|nr:MULTISPECIES: chemoreceptor glutamine deamidase CheD [Microvirgula]AVY93257.1 chemoreceptor glutamine deamidase CheD [Microvirgula aerodenitrificans]RAS19759.1 chemotaxis protein CheD [Microvirgula sp. AG722]